MSKNIKGVACSTLVPGSGSFQLSNLLGYSYVLRFGLGLGFGLGL